MSPTPPYLLTMSMSDVSTMYQRMELFVHDFNHLYHFLHPISPISVCSISISIYISVCLSLPVSTPSVSLSVPSGPLYDGTSQTLTCTVTLPEPVDSDVTVGVVWRFTNTQVVNSTSIQIPSVSSTRSPFTSTLTLSPLSMSDAGQFSCEATADSASQYITASSLGESLDKTVNVEGM